MIQLAVEYDPIKGFTETTVAHTKEEIIKRFLVAISDEISKPMNIIAETVNKTVTLKLEWDD